MVYLGPRAVAGEVRSRDGWSGMRRSPTLGPNSTVNRPVWSARLESASPCPGRASLPVAAEMVTGRARPGPVILAWVVPFASAGVASTIVTAMAAPAAREVRAMNLRGICGWLLPSASLGCTPQTDGRFPAGSARSASRGGDRERGRLAEAALQAQDDPGRAPDQRAAGGQPG